MTEGRRASPHFRSPPLAAAMSAPRFETSVRYRCRRDVLAREVEGEAVLLDLASGRYFGLNASGARIWALLEAEDGDCGAVSSRIAAEFGLALDVAAADVRELCRELETEGLLDRVG